MRIICPLCRLPLERQLKTWCCAKGHSFDVAREGYVNLLPVQQKNSREPGDSLEMVQARRDFLQAGHYQPLQQALIEMLAPLHAQAVLDLGCGEGYYTSAMTAAAAEVIGLDIAKPAIQIAAKRFRNITWLVATGASLPLADASLDVVCNVFTQIHGKEMARVLRPGGRILVVSPAPEHLLTLRERLFDDVRAHDPEKFIEELHPWFDLVQQQQVRVALCLQKASLQQLLMMTPYAWKAKPERRSALESLNQFSTQAAFNLMLFSKR